MMAVSAVGGAADSVWTGSVLAAFIYRLSGGSNAVVGYVEAASGMTTLFLGLPLGMCTRQPLRQLTVITNYCFLKKKQTTRWNFYYAGFLRTSHRVQLWSPAFLDCTWP